METMEKINPQRKTTSAKRGTPKQKKLAEAIVENAAQEVPKTYGQVIRDSGYSDSRALKPSELIDSPGVQAELDLLGFNEQKAKEVVGEILGDTGQQAKDRLKAAEMVFKVQGSFKDERPKDNAGNTYNFVFNSETQADVKALEEKIKARLINPHVREA